MTIIPSTLHKRRIFFILPALLVMACVLHCRRPAIGQEKDAAKTAAAEAPDKKDTIAARRLEVMTEHIESIVITSPDPAIPKQMQSKPLFRYDDETRGYVDGTVWRLGETGRPLAIITAELHPNYLGGGPRTL